MQLTNYCLFIIGKCLRETGNTYYLLFDPVGKFALNEWQLVRLITGKS